LAAAVHRAGHRRAIIHEGDDRQHPAKPEAERHDTFAMFVLGRGHGDHQRPQHHRQRRTMNAGQNRARRLETERPQTTRSSGHELQFLQQTGLGDAQSATAHARQERDP
jgi:hypothetical protein